MKTLIIDTSSNLLYISFYQDDNEIFNKVFEGNNNHSENLLNFIEDGLKETNLAVIDFDRIIVGVGPGSYTGLRVSLTVAKMFSWTLDIPLYTVSSLDILGSGYFSKDGLYAITSRAKKNHIYGKLIEVKKGIQNVVINDVFSEKQEFLNLIKNYNYFLVDSSNYLFDPKNLNISLVSELHQLIPNYIQREV